MILTPSREHLCGFDINLTYPQEGIIPTVNFIDARDRDVPFLERKNYAKRGLVAEITQRYAELDPTERDLLARQRERGTWKRDLSLRANGTLDPWVSPGLERTRAGWLISHSTDAHCSPNSSTMP